MTWAACCWNWPERCGHRLCVVSFDGFATFDGLATFRERTHRSKGGRALAPPTTSRPGRLLAALAALIVVLLIGVLGGSLFQPSHWHGRFWIGKGLDISSGTTITLQAVPPPGVSSTSAQVQTDLNTAQTIMNSRVNGAGFNGASVTTQTPDLINVSVPGKGVEQVENLVGTTAQLRFRQVLLKAPNTVSSTSAPGSLSTTTDPQAEG